MLKIDVSFSGKEIRRLARRIFRLFVRQSIIPFVFPPFSGLLSFANWGNPHNNVLFEFTVWEQRRKLKYEFPWVNIQTPIIPLSPYCSCLWNDFFRGKQLPVSAISNLGTRQQDLQICCHEKLGRWVKIFFFVAEQFYFIVTATFSFRMNCHSLESPRK